MITDREKKFADAITKSMEQIVGEPAPEKERLKIVQAAQALLPLWDNLMPLLVADIVKAVRKESGDDQASKQTDLA